MFFTSDDLAPESGVYKVIAPDGSVWGEIYIEAGGIIPPAVSPVYRFRIDSDN